MTIKGRGNIVKLNRRHAKSHPIYTITLPRAIVEVLGWKEHDLLTLKLRTANCLYLTKPSKKDKAKMIKQIEDVAI